MSERSLDSRYSWDRLALSVLAASVGNAVMWAVVVVMPGIAAEFGIGRSSAALAYTVTMAGFALGNVVFGRAVDRHGDRGLGKPGADISGDFRAGDGTIVAPHAAVGQGHHDIHGVANLERDRRSGVAGQ